MTQQMTTKAQAKISSFQRANAEENKRLTDRAIRKVIKHNLKVAHPERNGEALDIMVNEIMPRAMRPYRGPDALVAPKFVQPLSRAQERKRQVKANRCRR